MARSNEFLKGTKPDGDAVLSGRIYSEEFKKYIQTQKRFREAWMEFDAPWNHELFQYANEDFYFYRFNINRMEHNTAPLLRNIIFRLLDLHNVSWSKGFAPVLFKCVCSDGATVGYTFDDFYEDDDIAAICKDNVVEKVYIIRTWKGDHPAEWITRENAQYESHGIAVQAISVADFFIAQFGEAEYLSLIHISEPTRRS